MQFKRLADIAWRRKSWIAVPFVLATVASLAAVILVPKVYRATTTILVTRDSVPESIVRSTVTTRIEERMRSLELQVLSRAYLEPVARKLELIGADAGEAEIGEVCHKLRAQITPELDNRDFSWFRISADDVDPVRAASIANQLAELFIEHNSLIRTSQANETQETTSGWEAAYRAELTKDDEQISEFKRQNLHALPDQQPANAQFLIGAQNRVLQLKNDIRSRHDRLEALRSQLLTERPIPVGIDEARLATLEHELVELRGSYTEDNPLVKRKQAQIAELARSAALVTAPGQAGNSTVAAKIEQVESEIRALERERARENTTVQAYVARIRDAQLLQPKLLELTRNYDQAKQQFDIAAAQNERARNSQDVEESKTGVQFQIQDRAFPPEIPFKPDSALFVLVGVVFGLALGLGSAAAREFVDQTVRCEDEFASHFPDLPVYGVIPNLEPARLGHGGANRRIA